MSTPLANVVDFIDAQTALTVGTNLFEGYMGDAPLFPDACVAVYEYEGQVTDTFGTAEAITMPRFQVKVRGAVEDYATPRALIATIRTALAGVRPGTVTGIESIRPTGTVLTLGRDGNERPVFACNFQAMVNGA